MSLPHREHPCGVCPVRRDNAGNPASKFPASRWLALTATVCDMNGGSAPHDAPLFGCHKGAPGAEAADILCAGAAVAFGYESVRVRLAVAQGRLPREFLIPDHPSRANWPELFKDWAEMVAAQMWRPGDPDGHLVKGATRRSRVTAEQLLHGLPRMLAGEDVDRPAPPRFVLTNETRTAGAPLAVVGPAAALAVAFKFGNPVTLSGTMAGEIVYLGYTRQIWDEGISLEAVGPDRPTWDHQGVEMGAYLVDLTRLAGAPRLEVLNAERQAALAENARRLEGRLEAEEEAFLSVDAD